MTHTANTVAELNAKLAELRTAADEIRGRTANERAQLAAAIERQNDIAADIDRLTVAVHVHDRELFDNKRQQSTVAKAINALIALDKAA